MATTNRRAELGLVALVALVLGLALAGEAHAQRRPGNEQPPESVAHTMELPAEPYRAWCKNPDGSCVQCSIQMCGIWLGDPNAGSLLFDTDYGRAERGGSTPSRVAAYFDKRKIKGWNVTGDETWDWMRWAAKTGRFAAIGAGSRHFQTLYGWDEETNTWYVCDNNSTWKVDEYDWGEFQQLHRASGEWVVVLEPSSPAVPKYVPWWE